MPAPSSSPALPGPAGAVVVLGMHRSGTSCLAGMLASLGAQPPGPVVRNWDNARGHFEAAEVVRLNEAVLAHNGGHWLAPPTQVTWTAAHAAERDRLLALPGALLKDPRSLLVLPFWRAGRCRLVGIVRHPLAVAHSLRAWRNMPEADGLALWLAHNQALLDAHRAEDFPLLHFTQAAPAFIASVDRAAAALGLPRNLSALTAAYAGELVHHSADEPTPLPPVVVAVYHELRTRSGDLSDADSPPAPFPWAALATVGSDPHAAITAINQAADPTAVAVPMIAELLRRDQAAAALAVLAAVRLPPAISDLLAGKAHLAAGDAQAAVVALTRAATAPEPYWEARLLVPQALRRAGEHAAARTALRELVADALYPHGPLATLGEWALADGDPLAAQNWLSQAIAAAPVRRRGRLRCRLAEILIRDRDHDGARHQLTTALSEDPDWRRARELLASLSA